MANELVERDGKTARINLHPGQVKAWDSSRRFVFVIAGTQGGKTSFGPWWLHREIQRCGPGDYLAVTATYDLFKLKMLPEILAVFCALLSGWHWSASDRVVYSTDEKTRIILRSAQADGGLESATAKAAWLDECGQDSFRLESWEAVQRRLALHEGRALGTTTPYNLGWLKTQVFDRWRAGDKTFDVVQFKSTMNPRFPVAEYDRMRASMAAWKAAMFLDGDFARPAGMIYGDFDDDLNICDPFTLPADWARYVGIDFGGVHTAKVWLAEEPKTGTLYLYRESLDGNLTTKQHCERTRFEGSGERVVGYWGGAKSEGQWRMDWRAESVHVLEPPVGEVEAGIDRVIEAVKTRRLKVFRSCKGVLDEFGTYSRELNSDGEPTEKIKDKATFHRLDALRYVMAGLTGTVRFWAVPLGARA